MSESWRATYVSVQGDHLWVTKSISFVKPGDKMDKKNTETLENYVNTVDSVINVALCYKGEQDSQIWMPECDSFPRFSK